MLLLLDELLEVEGVGKAASRCSSSLVNLRDEEEEALVEEEEARRLLLGLETTSRIKAGSRAPSGEGR